MSATSPQPGGAPAPPKASAPPPSSNSTTPSNSPTPPADSPPPPSTSTPSPPSTTLPSPHTSGGSPSTPSGRSPQAPAPPTASAPPPSSNSTTPSNSPTPPADSPPPPSTSTPSPPSTTLPSPHTSGGSPSTPSGRSPPTPSSSTSPSSGSSSTGLVVGVAVGSVAVLVVLGLLCFLFLCRRSKKRRPPPPPPVQHHQGRPPPQPVKGDPHGGMPENWQHNAPPPVDHVVKIPPHPSPQPPLPPRPAPPPAPVINSSGGSGSNYSGPENPVAPPSPGIALGFSNSTFTYEELAMATNGFPDANLLGQGGFGFVHKGLLPNGKEVAVKQLKPGSGQGEREFHAEVEIISRVHHKHLVSLVGYCISQERRLLVYEYVPNNTLEFHLHGKGRPTMDWPTRLKIALGSAKGLAYLHEDCHPKIIHRDIKAANILLDFKFEAKVADFGLAKIASDNNTHVSTRVMGTLGYLAPEYASSGKLTDKSDVFSFGVMLLELITGRRPVDSSQSFVDDNLVNWARPLLTRALEVGNYESLVDPQLGKNYNCNEMARMIVCAAAAVRHSAKRRPRMSQIVRALEGDMSLEDLNEGIRPGHSRPFGSYGSADYDSGQYNEDLKKFRKMALQSQDHVSNEYSPPTSEYDQNPSASSSEGLQTHEMEMGKKKDSLGFSSNS